MLLNLQKKAWMAGLTLRCAFLINLMSINGSSPVLQQQSVGLRLGCRLLAACGSSLWRPMALLACRSFTEHSSQNATSATEIENLSTLYEESVAKEQVSFRAETDARCSRHSYQP